VNKHSAICKGHWMGGTPSFKDIAEPFYMSTTLYNYYMLF